MKKTITALFALSFFSLQANEIPTEQLAKRFNEMGIKEVSLESSPLDNIYTALTSSGVFYVSKDGKYLLDGRLMEVKSEKDKIAGVIDLTGRALVKKLNLHAKEMIVYPAKNEKYVVNVFLDISCHYCHLMFEQTQQYNDLGITMRYLAFPRGGMNNENAERMEAIWTAENPILALNKAEKERIYSTQLKTPNVVEKHYQLGVQFGIRGTPAIVTTEGTLLEGYIPPEQLIKILATK